MFVGGWGHYPPSRSLLWFHLVVESWESRHCLLHLVRCSWLVVVFPAQQCFLPSGFFMCILFSFSIGAKYSVVLVFWFWLVYLLAWFRVLFRWAGLPRWPFSSSSRLVPWTVLGDPCGFRSSLRTTSLNGVNHAPL